jgi:predicted O-methyltransferase YrrM
MFRLIFQYIAFRINAHSRHGHGIHSPFVYDLFSRALIHTKDEELNKLLHWRKKVEKDKTKIRESYFGAGSRNMTGGVLEAGKLVKLCGMPHPCGAMLYRLVKEFKPATVIELGTGLGISTAYLAMANDSVRVKTIEGSPERSNYARELLGKMKLSNIEFLSGEFGQYLPELLEGSVHPLIILVDGNHQYEPTIQYFEMILKYSNKDTIIIFDDIHWSSGMEKAWEDIRKNKKVTLSIDMFRSGLVFFREGMMKQDLLVNYFY